MIGNVTKLSMKPGLSIRLRSRASPFTSKNMKIKKLNEAFPANQWLIIIKAYFDDKKSLLY